MATKQFKTYRNTSTYFRKVKNNIKEQSNGGVSSNVLLNSVNIFLTPVCVRENINVQIRTHQTYEASDEATNEYLVHDLLLENIPEYEEINWTEHDNINNKLCLLEELRNWALTHKLTHAAVTDILKILKLHGMNDLPNDSRTLLKTPSITEIFPMAEGQYWYNGIKSNLQHSLNLLEKPISIKLIFNIDGISPYNSSTLEFWPILFMIDNMPDIKPMAAAIYYGRGKPPLEPFLSPFVKELNEIIVQGFFVNNNKVNVEIKCFVCDSPARSFIKAVVGFNAHHGCIKCQVIGEWDKRGHHMSFPRINSPRRTDQSFRKKTDEDHHKGTTPLIHLPMDLIEDVIIADSLHLFDLGIMRKCLYGWCHGSYNFRTKLSGRQLDLLSEMLENCNESKPKEIHRAIRGLKFLKYWKGSEFRTFLLYIGGVVLKDFLVAEVYEHFLMLLCAVTILSCQSYLKYLHIADALLKNYIEKYIDLYGIDSISSNVHNLCHVIDDVQKFGYLPGISSYPFENFLGHLKSLLRSGNRPLAQISRRIIELTKLTEIHSKKNYVHLKHETGLALPNCKKMYNTLHIGEEFILSNNIKNKWFLTKNDNIVSMKAATYVNDQFYIYGSALENKTDFFIKPLRSSNLNIYAVNEEKLNAPKLYNLKEVKCKLFFLNYHKSLVFFPLLHSLDYLVNYE